MASNVFRDVCNELNIFVTTENKDKTQVSKLVKTIEPLFKSLDTSDIPRLFVELTRLELKHNFINDLIVNCCKNTPCDFTGSELTDILTSCWILGIKDKELFERLSNRCEKIVYILNSHETEK